MLILLQLSLLSMIEWSLIELILVLVIWKLWCEIS